MRVNIWIELREGRKTRQKTDADLILLLVVQHCAYSSDDKYQRFLNPHGLKPEPHLLNLKNCY